MEENQVSDAKLRARAKHCVEKNPHHISRGEFNVVKASLLEAIDLQSKIMSKTDDDYYEMAVLHYSLAALCESHFHNKSDARQFYQLAIDYLNKIKNPDQDDVELMKVYQWHLSKIITPELPLSQVGPSGHFSTSDVNKNSQVEKSMANNEQERIGDDSETKIVKLH